MFQRLLSSLERDGASLRKLQLSNEEKKDIYSLSCYFQRSQEKSKKTDNSSTFRLSSHDFEVEGEQRKLIMLVSTFLV